MTKLLCVYCSSSRELAPKYYEEAQAVGRSMVAHGWGLVYGGGGIGLMGSLARSVKAAGGYVVGVIPEFMIERELEFRQADELLEVKTMPERKHAMIARADAFLALPGGIGTLEEISEILSLRVLAQLLKPAVFYNQGGFYDELFSFFDQLTRERFRSTGIDGLYSVANSIDEIWPCLEKSAGFKTVWQAKT